MTAVNAARPKRISSISAVFPAFNDGGSIASMISTACIALRQVSDDYEVVVVNDGSIDYTATVLEEMKDKYPELRVIHHLVNCGYGAALRSGFKAATKDWIFYTDGDSQYNPLELTLLVDALRDGVDAVNGYKLTRNDSLLRVIIGRAYHNLVKIFFGIRIRDVDCDFRLIPRRILEEIELESQSGAICLEMVKKIEDAGYIFAEAPVSHYSRKYGVSQFFVPSRILRTGRQLATLYWKLVIQKRHRSDRKI
ncbi:MAG: glycosyltransferase family 2 protein [Anaerolineales bacterium]|nr:glycosyltransferase family 2 protein [Anaerolineales bacterium]